MKIQNTLEIDATNAKYLVEVNFGAIDHNTPLNFTTNNPVAISPGKGL